VGLRRRSGLPGLRTSPCRPAAGLCFTPDAAVRRCRRCCCSCACCPGVRGQRWRAAGRLLHRRGGRAVVAMSVGVAVGVPNAGVSSETPPAAASRGATVLDVASASGRLQKRLGVCPTVDFEQARKIVRRHGGDPRLTWRPRSRLRFPWAKRLSAADEIADARLSAIWEATRPPVLTPARSEERQRRALADRGRIERPASASASAARRG
jgi:hypothetical protein